MANKVPIGRTIAGAYGFAFGNIINNIGQIWIPLAVLYGITFLFQGPYMDAMSGMMARDPQAAMRALPLFFGFMLAFLVLLAGAYAGLTKEALGLRTGSAFLQFPLGAGTWRLIAANILLALVMCVIYIAFVIAAFIIGAIVAAVAGGRSTGGTTMAAGLLAVTVGVVVLCAMTYIGLRLSFLLAPVTIAEQRISLIRAWQLTKGSFWRIFVVMLAVLVPLIIAEGFFFALFFKDFFAGFHPGMSPDELARMQERQMEINRAFMEKQNRYWFIAIPIGFVVTAIAYGLFAGAGASAYKAVAPSDGSSEAEVMS